MRVPVLVALALVAAAPAREPPPPPGTAWRGARWGMTPGEVVAALGGDAVLLDPAVSLPDGNVVAAGIDGLAWEGLVVDVRFVFSGGRLALVSLRTPNDRYAEVSAYESLRKALAARWGEPLESTSSDAFIDMRQTRWDRGDGRVDVKYIPGVVAVVVYPRPAAPSPGPREARPAPAQ